MRVHVCALCEHVCIRVCMCTCVHCVNVYAHVCACALCGSGHAHCGLRPVRVPCAGRGHLGGGPVCTGVAWVASGKGRPWPSGSAANSLSLSTSNQLWAVPTPPAPRPHGEHHASQGPPSAALRRGSCGRLGGLDLPRCQNRASLAHAAHRQTVCLGLHAGARGKPLDNKCPPSSP